MGCSWKSPWSRNCRSLRRFYDTAITDHQQRWCNPQSRRDRINSEILTISSPRILICSSTTQILPSQFWWLHWMCFLFLIIYFNFSPFALHRFFDPIQINCRHKLKLSFEFSYLNEFLSLPTWDELSEIITSLLSIGSRVLKRTRFQDNLLSEQVAEIF